MIGTGDPSSFKKYFLYRFITNGSAKISSVFGLAAGFTYNNVFIS